MCMYVGKICAEGIFVSFPLCLKNVKSRSKITLFSNQHHFEIWFPKKKTITFFRRKLSKQHKKDTILPVTITFSLKHRANKNKRWTHLGALNIPKFRKKRQFVSNLISDHYSAHILYSISSEYMICVTKIDKSVHLPLCLEPFFSKIIFTS